MNSRLIQRLDEQLAQDEPALPTFKQALKDSAADLAARFHADEDVVDLVHARAKFTDAVLQRIWQQQMPESVAAALIAVGGYGRGELHPASDIDLLILTRDDPQALGEPLESLVMFLWDIGLEVGHSVRSVQQCIDEAAADLTVITNLMESRLLAGSEALFNSMRELTSPDRMWPSEAFFSAKQAEQKKRHIKYDGRGYNLEPNIKGNPGGLRDIQMIGWVVKRHIRGNRLSDLVRHGFLTEHEYHSLKKGEKHLWRIRFALHLLSGRHEDRLLFEYQRVLAEQFDYCDEDRNLAVEQFMQDYYRSVQQLQRLNEMLLQLFQESILLNNELGEPRPLNRRFQARSDYLEVINPGIFARYPLALLELFLVLQQNPELKGARASTIRLVRAHRHLIDDNFRHDIRAQSLFIEIMRQPTGITHELRRMNRYGILGRYIPAFGKITGLMQFDLFHIYTVDEHTLMVVRNLRRFFIAKHADECSLCHKVSSRIAKPELIYLAGLFHDIAKGRGGNHAELGAIDARNFCLLHHLSNYDSSLVAWLVQKHLMMSRVAQQQDIDDIEVIQEFAGQVGTQQRLDYLYLLTAADMRGTNPAHWNSWKSALLGRLHSSTSQALERGLAQPQIEDDLIGKIQNEARDILLKQGIDQNRIHDIWIQLSTDYFLYNQPQTIAWQTQLLLKQDQAQQLSVRFRVNPEQGCTEIFIFGPDRDNLFAQSTALLDQLGLNILGARIEATDSGVSINNFAVLEEEDGSCIDSEQRKEEIRSHLLHELNQAGDEPLTISRRIPRQLQHFQTNSDISFDQDERKVMTELKLQTSDRPGLLSQVGAVFAEHSIRVHSARVATAGAIAQDSFLITDRQDQPITNEAIQQALAQSLHEQLDG